LIDSAGGVVAQLADDLATFPQAPIWAVDGDLDPDIAPIVQHLRAHGIRTTSSCQGGEKHLHRLPQIRFLGTEEDARRAVLLTKGGIARRQGMDPFEVRHCTEVLNRCYDSGERHWNLVFFRLTEEEA
jgi:hypothetical protein